MNILTNYSPLEKRAAPKPFLAERPHNNYFEKKHVVLDAFSQAFIQMPPSLLDKLENAPLPPLMKKRAKEGAYFQGTVLPTQDGKIWVSFSALPTGRGGRPNYYEIPKDGKKLEVDVIPCKVITPILRDVTEIELRKFSVKSWWQAFLRTTNLTKDVFQGACDAVIGFINARCFNMKYEKPTCINMDGEGKYRNYLPKGFIDKLGGVTKYKAIHGLCYGNLVFLKLRREGKTGYRFVTVLAHELMHNYVNQDIAAGRLDKDAISNNDAMQGHGFAFFEKASPLSKINIELMSYAYISSPSWEALDTLAEAGGERSNELYMFFKNNTGSGGGHTHTWLVTAIDEDKWKLVKPSDHKTYVIARCPPFFHKIAEAEDSYLTEATFNALLSHPKVAVLAKGGSGIPDVELPSDYTLD